MIILKIVAFWLPVIGIGGIIGAIETGTSPVNAVVALLIGCVALAVYTKLDSVRYRRDKEIDRFIFGTCKRKTGGKGGGWPWDIKHAHTVGQHWIQKKNATARMLRRRNRKTSPPAAARQARKNNNHKYYNTEKEICNE